MDHSTIPIRNLVEAKHRFLVKDYQRGYKWTESHITALLNDVDHHQEGNGKYCLQPLIVAPTEFPTEYELIDGQQRLTSIYLLLSFLQNGSAVGYTLSYATREKSRRFIDEKVSALFEWLEENETDAGWEEFIEDEQFSAFDNVDVYHFFIVARTIHQWFEHSSRVDKAAFLNKLLDQVNVIWYDASLRSNQNGEPLAEHFAEDVFLNLNAGKIPLTGSELIKALFILECRQHYSKEIALLKTNELAAEWDAIENKLQDDAFWYFLCNDPFYSEAGTRIDFLLDLVNGILGKKDRLAAYRAYEQKFFSGTQLDWQAVKHAYNKLLEWYNDKTLFHYIGFIIASRLSTLDKILKGSKGKSKAEFVDYLQGVIKREFWKTARTEDGATVDVYDLDTLNYVDNRKECERLLLLLNVCHYINGHSANRFPFDLYRKDRWSVEHINPQNPRDFTTIGELRLWLKAQKEYFLSIDNDSDSNEGKVAVEKHASRIESSFAGVADSQPLQSKITEGVGERLDTLVENLTTHLGLHLIGNLTLLDKATNSRLSNRLFMEKRKLVLQFDSVGHTDEGDEKKPVFIPVCTKNVFSKVYTKSESSVANTFFGKRDMDDYVTTIREQLSGFLKSLKDDE